MHENLLSPEEISDRLELLEASGFPSTEVKRLAQNLATYCYGAAAEEGFLGLVDRVRDEGALVELMDHLARRIWPTQELSLNTDSSLLLSDLASRGFDEVTASTTGVKLGWRGIIVQEVWRTLGHVELRDETAAVAAVKVLGVAHMRDQQGRSGL